MHAWGADTIDGIVKTNYTWNRHRVSLWAPTLELTTYILRSLFLTHC